MKIDVQPQAEIIETELYLLAALSKHDEQGDENIGQLANEAAFEDDNLSAYTNSKVWGDED